MIAVAGRCNCGQQVMRADTNGAVLTIDIHPVDAATELRAWAAGRRSYQYGWSHGHLTVNPRTDTDIKLKPVGYRAGDRVVLTHRCPLTEGDAQ